MVKMKEQFVHYDSEGDVIGFYIGKGHEEDFIEIAPNISLEFDKHGAVIGLEIINASKILRPFLKSLEKRSPIRVR